MAWLSLCGETVDEGVERYLALIARVEVAQARCLALELVLAEEDGDPRPHLVGALHAAREIAVEAELDGNPAMAEVARDAEGGTFRRRAYRDDRDGPRRERRLARQHGEPLDAARPSHARGRRTAHGLGEPVVTPAGDHGPLRAELVRGELEHRVAVIIESAHDAGVERIVDPGRFKRGLDLCEEGPRRVIEVVEEDRRIGDYALVGLVLRVKHAQGIALEARAAVGG